MTLVGNRYRLGASLGGGGFGAVYEAVDTRLDARVAVKLLHNKYLKRTELVSRFEREARVVQKVAHPNVVRVSDFEVERDGAGVAVRCYLVMELLDGETVSDWLAARRGQPTPDREVLDLLEPVIRAVAAAHGQDVAHRDLNPNTARANAVKSPTSPSRR